MPILTLGLDHPPAQPDTRLPPGQNHGWHSFQHSDRCVVFVHGLGDNSRDCWYRKEAGSYWPDRLRSCADFHDYSIYLGGYDTSKFLAGEHGIADCADQLYESLEIPNMGRMPVLEHQGIVFVCHSLGGIVTRYMLEEKRDIFRDKSVGLALIASPSTGSGWADAVRYLAEVLHNDQVLTLRGRSALLKELDRKFKNLIHNNLIPNLFGREACETEGYSRLVSRVVKPESAGRYFGAVKRLAHTNHSTCVKPDSDSHEGHTFLISLIRGFEKKMARVLSPRRAVQLVCGRLRWSVLIENEDGDAINETSLLDVTAAPMGKYDLPATQQESGYFSAPELSVEESSGAVKLETVDSGDTRLRFENDPLPDTPLTATFRFSSANAYSMHRRELLLKTGRNDGEDFVEKRIHNEQIRELVIHVRLPEAMCVSGNPYAKVLELTGSVDLRESARIAAGLDYSPLLRTISLMVRNPIPDRRYRVCWRLSALAGSEVRPSDEERVRHDARVGQLLWLRACSTKSDRTAREQQAIDKLFEILGACGGLVRPIVGSEIPAGQTEISLMVVDDSEEDRAAQLRLVAGTNAEGSWNEPMAVGDGNAGRACKRQAVRIYDYEKGGLDPRNYVYRPKPGRKPHRWLISIPLVLDHAVYGIFNLGTFNKAQVPLFRRLEGSVQTLAEAVENKFRDGLNLIEWP